MDTDFATLAISRAEAAGRHRLARDLRIPHLPPGTYRVLAYRTGSQMSLSPPVTLATGKATHLDLTLPPTEPAGNIVENPDARLSYLEKGVPDRWRALTVAERTVWTSPAAQ